MPTSTSDNFRRLLASILLGGSLLMASGCINTPPSQVAPGDVAPGIGQPQFATDDEAFQAMLTAAKNADHDEVHHILGPAWKELVSGDKVEDANGFKQFSQRASEKMRLEKVSDTLSVVHVGNDDWPFPIPIARLTTGKWYFDTEEGKTEILARRIGRNELEAIDVCHKVVMAQREYRTKDRDGSGVQKYAARIISTPGKMDGLYWKAENGREQSPLEHLFAAATTEGYKPAEGHHEPLHGYLYRMVKRQGPAAAGGKADYIVNGNLTGGFAVLAFPAEYESSGIMTFIVNQNGKIYQQDLGPKTTEIARKMTEYNPDGSWTEVKE